MLNQDASSSELFDLAETIESLFDDDNYVVAQTVLAVTHILDQNNGKKNAAACEVPLLFHGNLVHGTLT